MSAERVALLYMAMDDDDAVRRRLLAGEYSDEEAAELSAYERKLLTRRGDRGSPGCNRVRRRWSQGELLGAVPAHHAQLRRAQPHRSVVAGELPRLPELIHRRPRGLTPLPGPDTSASSSVSERSARSRSRARAAFRDRICGSDCDHERRHGVLRTSRFRRPGRDQTPSPTRRRPPRHASADRRPGTRESSCADGTGLDRGIRPCAGRRTRPRGWRRPRRRPGAAVDANVRRRPRGTADRRAGTRVRLGRRNPPRRSLRPGAHRGQGAPDRRDWNSPVSSANRSKRADEDDRSDALGRSSIADPLTGVVLTDQEISAHTRNLCQAASGATLLLIGNVMYELLVAPDRYHQVKRRPELDTTAVESLRHDPPNNFVRRVCTAPVEVTGTRIDPDDEVMISLASANRDAARFSSGLPLGPGAPAGTPGLWLGAALLRRRRARPDNRRCALDAVIAQPHVPSLTALRVQRRGSRVLAHGASAPRRDLRRDAPDVEHVMN